MKKKIKSKKIISNNNKKKRNEEIKKNIKIIINLFLLNFIKLNQLKDLINIKREDNSLVNKIKKIEKKKF